MGFSVTHRQVGVTRANVAGLIRHEFRDVDRHNGVETQHSNEKIVPQRTVLNRSIIFRDGVASQMERSGEILEELDRRLETACGYRTNKKTGERKKTAVRKDAGVVRDLVLQLDPTFTRSSEYLVSDQCPEEHYEVVTDHMTEMIEYYAEIYGRENLLAASLHLDETSPHMHLMVTPIDEQGRVRNASFIADGRGSKSGLAKNDRAMRQYLIERGYDAAPEPTGVNRNHMPPEVYARFKDAEVELEDRAMMLQQREENVEQRELVIGGREGKVAAREEIVSTKEQDLSQKATELAQKRQETEEALRVAQASARIAEGRVSALDEELEKTRGLFSKMAARNRQEYAQAMSNIERRVGGLRKTNPDNERER